MARTNVPIQTPTTSAPAATSTAMDTTNDHVIAAGGDLTHLVIRLNNTTAATKEVTIKAGDNPPALSAGQGDLTISMAQDAVKVVSGLESARFIQADGTLEVDLASGMTGFIECYRTV